MGSATAVGHSSGQAVIRSQALGARVLLQAQLTTNSLLILPGTMPSCKRPAAMLAVDCPPMDNSSVAVQRSK